MSSSADRLQAIEAKFAAYMEAHGGEDAPQKPVSHSVIYPEMSAEEKRNMRKKLEELGFPAGVIDMSLVANTR